ncbi:kinase [Rossellomorea oryzaecorticis]|uniref:Kinase n=1 Tax=Rossellomorea oryzaecorticis TaxID=1396505 RepID=A0ABW8VQX1_9BACI
MELGKLTKTLISQRTIERPLIIGIDGLGGSGKTTLALQLKNELEAASCESVILHIDDYIVEREKRYLTGHEEWYEYYYLQWDVKVIQAELFEKLHSNISLLTLPFYDNSINNILYKKVNVPANGFIIIEGVFLQRKEWRGFFDYMIFLECNQQLRSTRVLGRDVYLGEYQARVKKYQQRYWLAEDYYVKKENPIGHADYIYQNIKD